MARNQTHRVQRRRPVPGVRELRIEVDGTDYDRLERAAVAEGYPSVGRWLAELGSVRAWEVLTKKEG